MADDPSAEQLHHCVAIDLRIIAMSKPPFLGVQNFENKIKSWSSKIPCIRYRLQKQCHSVSSHGRRMPYESVHDQMNVANHPLCRTKELSKNQFVQNIELTDQ